MSRDNRCAFQGALNVVMLDGLDFGPFYRLWFNVCQSVADTVGWFKDGPLEEGHSSLTDGLHGIRQEVKVLRGEGGVLVGMGIDFGVG